MSYTGHMTNEEFLRNIYRAVRSYDCHVRDTKIKESYNCTDTSPDRQFLSMYLQTRNTEKYMQEHQGMD